MKRIFEKIFKRESSVHNYVIGEYKPSRGKAMSKPDRLSEYDIEVPARQDEMQIDNIYKQR